MTCNARGYPQPAISWFKDDHKLHACLSSGPGDCRSAPYISNVHKVTNKTEGSLMIRKAKTSDGGEYTCKASNPIGSHNASFRLSVLGKYEVFSS